MSRRGDRRRRAERPARTPDRAARGRLERLDVLGQRRAAVPQGRQPAADARRTRRRHAGRRCVATSSSRSTPGSTCCGSTATSPPRPLYDAADELGVLLLQDFPLQWGYARSVRGQAVDQARAAVDLLGHHPSIVQWTAHNDPAAVAIGIEGDTRAQPAALHGRAAAAVVEQDGPRPMGEAVVREGRPDPAVVPHSGVLPHFPLLDGTDSHFYFGWYHGDVRDIDRLAARSAAPGPVRVGVRRPGGAGDGRLHRPGAMARPRLGRARRAARPAEVGVRPARAARPVRHVRRVAARHADVPGRADAPPHRECCAG